MKKFLIGLVAAALIGSPAVASKIPKEVSKIQETAERVIKYKDDAPNTDTWNVAVKSGDCEDIVLWKRAALIAAGYSEDDLQVMILRQAGKSVRYKHTRAVEAHVVLRIKSLNVVLDNEYEKFATDYNVFLKDHAFTEYCQAVHFDEVMNLKDRCLNIR